MAIEVAIAIAPPLVLSKGLNSHRIFSRLDMNIDSTSQVPPTNIFVPSTNLKCNEQPITPVGNNTPQKKSYNKNREIQLLWLLLFPWAKPIYEEQEVTKVICKVCSKICGKSMIVFTNVLK